MYEYLEADGKDVLDLGAGFGIEALLVAIYGARRVLATEIDRDMVAVGAHWPRRSIRGPGSSSSPATATGSAWSFLGLVRRRHGQLRDLARGPRGSCGRRTGCCVQVIFFLSDENNLCLPAGRAAAARMARQKRPNGLLLWPRGGR